MTKIFRTIFLKLFVFTNNLVRSFTRGALVPCLARLSNKGLLKLNMVIFLIGLFNQKDRHQSLQSKLVAFLAKGHSSVDCTTDVRDALNQYESLLVAVDRKQHKFQLRWSDKLVLAQFSRSAKNEAEGRSMRYNSNYIELRNHCTKTNQGNSRLSVKWGTNGNTVPSGTLRVDVKYQGNNDIKLTRFITFSNSVDANTICTSTPAANTNPPVILTASGPVYVKVDVLDPSYAVDPFDGRGEFYTLVQIEQRVELAK